MSKNPAGMTFREKREYKTDDNGGVKEGKISRHTMKKTSVKNQIEKIIE